MTQYLFGYGSLICPESRSITAPTVSQDDVIPVVVQHVERTWTARSKHGHTAMGVRFRRDAECTGVLMQVSNEELKTFDRRERGYERYKIPLDHIEQVPFLEDCHHYEDDHPVLRAKENETLKEEVDVWIYVKKNNTPPDETHPIAQSYVDIILRGCLHYGEEFARSFIETTQGWHPDDLSDIESKEGVNNNDDEENANSGSENDNGNGSVVWVDDRDDPLYVRADSEFSQEHAHVLDRLLEEHAPLALENRVKLDEIV